MDAAHVGGVNSARGWRDLRVLVLALSVGVLALLSLPQLPPLLVYAGLAASALWPWRGQAAWAACVLGLLLCGWHAQRYLDQRWPAVRHGEQLWVEGIVASLPERAVSGEGESADWRFAFETTDRALPPRLRVSWYRTTETLAGGQCWRLLLRLRTPHGSLNPGGFDYEAWLLRQGVGATATVRDAQACASPPGYRVLRLRQHIVDRLRGVLGDTRAAALAAALIVGDTSALRDVDWQRFRVTGTTHLVAISGFNLAIVAGFAFVLLRWAWALWPRLCLWVPAQRVALYGSGLAAAAYALLAGFEAPVTRALIMLLVLITAAAAHRLHEPTRALAYAWGLILLLDPFAALAPGLWLSFGAVAAILYASLGRLRLPPAWRLAVRVQLFLSLALIPLGLHFFDGLAWLSPLVNLAAVPLFSLLTPLLMLSVLALGAYEPLGMWGLQAGGWLLEALYRGLALLADVAPAAWVPASPPAAALALASLGAVLAFLPRGVPMRGLALPCLAVLALPRSGAAPTQLEITALDVGQGSAIVVRTRQHALLFDAGPAFDEGFDAGRSIVAPYLLEHGLRRLDLLVLSHGDNDHAGGVAAVRELVDVGGEIGTDTGVPCEDGRAWEWDGVRFQFLHPVQGAWSDNDRSCVLRIDGPFSVLLPGDIERSGEQRLLWEHPQQLRADVLLSPHHGSKTSSTPAFVAAVQPGVVVHSAGWRSRFGHPRAEVVERYAQLNARQITTGVSGAVRIRKDPDGNLEVETWRPRAARWWNAAAEP